ncbi:MAG: hypothetical protein ACI9NQ_001139 [Paracoccaceae bacterium]|jgi:hypothetical protein
MSLHLNIIARTNGVGLDRDVDLVRDLAQAAGHKVKISHSRGTSPLFVILPQRSIFDANIFMERVFTRWIGAAKTNILIPNQERFPERHLGRLGKIDHIFCKTEHGLEAFQKHHPSCHLTRFTSKDLLDDSIPRKPKSFLHLAGRSTLKGTATVLSTWAKHPEWPELTLLQHADNAPAEVPKNVRLITDYLSDDEIVKLANEHQFHLCPSESEGWGHYLVEAMSCRASVITTDAPPMNELVTTSHGLLAKFHTSQKRHLGTNFFVDPGSLEQQIETALMMSTDRVAEMGEAARAWMIQNDETFRATLTALLEQLISPS